VEIARGELVEKELTAFIEQRDRQRHGAGAAWQLVLGGRPKLWPDVRALLQRAPGARPKLCRAKNGAGTTTPTTSRRVAGGRRRVASGAGGADPSRSSPT